MNGVVDTADYVIWRNNNGIASGATLSQGDSNGDGAVNNADLSIWRSNFGNLRGTVSGAGSLGGGCAGAGEPPCSSSVAFCRSSHTEFAGQLLAAENRPERRDNHLQPSKASVNNLYSSRRVGGVFVVSSAVGEKPEVSAILSVPRRNWEETREE